MIATMECDDSCGVLGDLCHDRFPDCFAAPWHARDLSLELLTTETGSQAWERITTMAEAALRARRLDVATACPFSEFHA